MVQALNFSGLHFIQLTSSTVSLGSEFEDSELLGSFMPDLILIPHMSWGEKFRLLSNRKWTLKAFMRG